MKILLKDVVITTQEKKRTQSDILINDQTIERICNNIETKNIDFTFFLEKRVTTSSLILNHPEPISIFQNLVDIVKDGIKMGCTDFIFTLKNTKTDFINQIIKLFKKTYIRGLFTVDKDIDFKINDIYFTKNIDNPEEFIIKLYNKTKYIEKGKDASIVVWDTKKSLTIPYLVISQGKIIEREGSFIFL